MDWDEAEAQFPGCSIEWDVLHQEEGPPEVWLDVPSGRLWASEPRSAGDGRWVVDNWGWNPNGADGRGEWIKFPSMAGRVDATRRKLDDQTPYSREYTGPSRVTMRTLLEMDVIDDAALGRAGGRNDEVRERIRRTGAAWTPDLDEKDEP